jgi:serine/threonine protein kinase
MQTRHQTNPARPRLPEGELLNGRYRMGKKLGAGGFAIVYEAFDTLIERPVALKLLTSLVSAQDEEDVAAMLARFRREARAAAQFKHPNVVTIFDMGVAEHLEQPFIVMERLEGHDLKAELRLRGPLAPGRALRLLGRILEALAQGHRAGIIHRDLKPSNLFLIDPGQPHEDIRLLDFGIARMDDAHGGATSRDNLFGTANYLPPEYIRDRLVTPQMDI